MDEPLLLFGGRHQHIDPKTGLGLYGPYSVGDQEWPSLTSITIGIIGPPILVSDTRSWLTRCQSRIVNDGTQPYLYPHFPGFSPVTMFQCRLVFGDTWQEVITPETLKQALEVPDYYERLGQVITRYAERLRNLSERTPKPDVVICAIPDDVIELCTVRTTRSGVVKRRKLTPAEKQAQRAREVGQAFLPGLKISLGTDDEDVLAHHNLRRGLKAQAMPFGIPTQIVLPRTLREISPDDLESRTLQDPATRAWNLTTALYYKAGGHPWRLAHVQPGTCYVGISFYRERFSDNPRLRTSLAQVFTHTGDGLVLRGRPFEWDDPRRSPHLTEEGALNLLQDALALYRRHTQSSPQRVVVHKSSRYWDEELDGFREALRGIPFWDLVAFGKRKIQFLRQGDYPPLRGTWVRFADDNFLLYTRGYVPYLRTYPGMRVPQPLEILEHFGTSPPDLVLRETLALTKMNWNTADFSCEEPITLAFARRVGEILAELPEHIPPHTEYRFYM